MSRSKKSFFKVGKMVAPAVAAALVVTLATMNACTPSDRGTEDREEALNQNAAEAEAAEAQMAEKNGAPEKDVKKEAHKDAKKADKVEKASAQAEKKDKSKRAVASVAGGVYVVQVGAFKMKENAEKLQAKLKQAGYPAEMQTIEHSKNGLLHLVRFQPTQSKAEAETMAEDLHAKQDLHAQVLAVSATH